MDSFKKLGLIHMCLKMGKKKDERERERERGWEHGCMKSDWWDKA